MSNGFNTTDFDTPESYDSIALPGRGAVIPGTNTPSKPTAQRDGGGNSQRDRRFTDTFFDVHRSPRFPKGRPWTGEREFAANPDKGHEPGFVTADLQQGEYVTDDAGNVDRAATFRSGWSAPWIPLAKYFKFNYKRKLISFDYQRMLTDEQQAYDRYYEAAAIMGAGLNIRVEEGVMPSFQITAKMGYPTRFVPIAQAALAGDPWLLGHIDEPNVELAKILGYTPAGIRRSFRPETPPIITPEQVLGAPSQADLLKLIAELSAKVEQLSQAKEPAKRSHHKKKDSVATASAP